MPLSVALPAFGTLYFIVMLYCLKVTATRQTKEIVFDLVDHFGSSSSSPGSVDIAQNPPMKRAKAMYRDMAEIMYRIVVMVNHIIWVFTESQALSQIILSLT